MHDANCERVPTGEASTSAASREWEEMGGFRKRAPDESRRAEENRIRQKDEQAVQQLRERKRQEAQQLIRTSSCGKVGYGEHGHADMQEARMALVAKLERESDPTLKRLKKKEQEQQQRQEEQRRREENQRARRQEWEQRQQRQAISDRAINQAKQSRWQSWDEVSGQRTAASATLPPLSSGEQRCEAAACAATVDETDEEMDETDEEMDNLLGRWRCASGSGKEYFIQGTPSGQFRFSDPSGGGGGITGILTRVEGSLRAQLTKAGGRAFGEMRFLPLEGEDGTLQLISKFRKIGCEDWGKDNFAVKVPEGTCNEQQREYSDQTGAGGTAAAEPGRSATSSLAAESVRSPMRTGFQDRLIDTDIWQCEACTLVNPANISCCDACGNARPRPGGNVLQLRPAVAPTHAKGQCAPPVGSTGSTTAATAASAAAATVTVVSGSSGSAAASASTGQTKTQSQPATLLAWLRENRLSQYHELLVEQGFEELDDLLATDEKELDQVFDLVGVKPGHMMRLRRALRNCSVAGAAAVGTQKCGRECPVCLLGPQVEVNVALSPCGHIFCMEHASHALKSGECPLCRGQPSTLQTLFLG